MSILREYTNHHHRWVEAKPFVQYLLGGTITKEHYIMYLQQFFRVYSNLEYYSELSGLLTDLPGLKRAENILKDLEELESVQLGPIWNSTEAYRKRITDLYYDQDKQKQLFAHVYVRHMGDLYGGKVIAKRVPGSGKAYEFDDRPGLIKAMDSKLSTDLVDEAILGFELSGQIFDELWEKIQNE